jgi:hypothetical protein
LGRASMKDGFLPPDEAVDPLLPVCTRVIGVKDCGTSVADLEKLPSWAANVDEREKLASNVPW